jgi:hypothetical protein
MRNYFYALFEGTTNTGCNPKDVQQKGKKAMQKRHLNISLQVK